MNIDITKTVYDATENVSYGATINAVWNTIDYATNDATYDFLNDI